MGDDTITQSIRENDQVNRSHRKALLRFFSVESDINMAPDLTSPEITYNFYSKDFLLKIVQLLMGLICAGLYGEAVKIMTDSVTFLCFPNVVFSSYIIITAVIIMSYMLGEVMPDVLQRVFISIGMILYFISATVTITIWCNKTVIERELQMAKKCLLIQAVLSYVNSFFYGLDMFFNIKKAIIFEI